MSSTTSKSTRSRRTLVGARETCRSRGRTGSRTSLFRSAVCSPKPVASRHDDDMLAARASDLWAHALGTTTVAAVTTRAAHASNRQHA